MTSPSTDIRPFRIAIPDAELADLQDRLARTRWPADMAGAGWSHGIPLGYVQELTLYWQTTYDWRVHEARLNAWPQFTTEIDGANVHFLDIRSPEPDALPLIMTHGWPGSVAELLEVIGPLTDPGAHGGDRRDAFHLVLPSLPGYGFSGPTRDGWNVPRIARAWAELMARLGHARYGAQGGDWGSVVSRELGVIDTAHIVGVHLNMLYTPAPRDPAQLGELTDVEKARLEIAAKFQAHGRGYSMIQATRPQTLAYGLTDSPVGQLAWIAEKFKEWSDSRDRPEDAVDRDQLLTNVMIYWLTRTAGSSARLYYESMQSWGRPAPSQTPTGVAVFPKELTPPIRRFAERSNHIVQWTEFDRGGHFAAMEQPELLVGDIRALFRRLR
jgi:pimeloyl-ACP methyl ester carboxylesterase